MFKKFKLFKNGNADKAIDELKATESSFINSVNAELVKMHAVNEACYELCPKKLGQNKVYAGCTACNECGKLKGVI